jgi:P4 family phage/plasmid primase-like protien
VLLTRHDATDTICITALKGVDGRTVATERFCTGVDEAAEAAALIERNYQREDIKAIWSNLQRLKPGETKRKNETIDSYTNLLIDIDRKNKKDAQGQKINATEEERKVLLEAANQAAAFLSPGFGQPVFADSGNGYHLSWRIGDAVDWGKGIPVEQGQELYKRLLALLKNKFERPDLNMEIDASLDDDTQLITVWGTYNRKYPDLPGRPQRQSEMLSIPGHVEAVLSGDLKHPQVVTSFMIEQILLTNPIDDLLVEESKPAARGGRKQDKQTANQDWLENYGVPDLIAFWSPGISYESDSYDKNGEEHHPITPCPCHKDEDFHEHSHKRDCEIIVFPNGGIGISCFSRDLGLKQVIKKMNEIKGEKYPHLIFEQESAEELVRFFGAEDAAVPKAVPKEDEERKARREKLLTITPEEQKEIERIRKEETLLIFERNDLGNAARFELRHSGEFLWTSATHWLYYRNGLWVEDKTHKADQAMVNTIHKIEEEAELTTDEDEKSAIKEFAAASKSNRKIKDALERGEKCVSFARDYSDFDRHEQFFHVANGEYNLETGTLVPHSPDFLATKGSKIKYDPTAECPGFESYLHQVMGGNENLIAYLRRSVGYTLTVATGEAAMFILTGPGGTGKTTFLNILRGVLGTYAKRAQRGTFMAKRGDEGQPFDYAGLEGCRAFISSETDEGKQIAVSKVKELTGNEESLTACRKFKDSYEFKPKCKVWLACNDFPKAPAGDEALWDRLKPIPFNVRFRDTKEEVKDLSAKLIEEEGSGILNWALRGLEEYMEIGLAVPKEAKQCAEELREEQDFLGRFLEERTAKTYDNAEMVKTSTLYETFRWHADITGEGRGWTRQGFNAEMRSKKFEDKKVRVGEKTAEVWIGVKVVNSYTAETFAMADTEEL